MLVVDWVNQLMLQNYYHQIDLKIVNIRSNELIKLNNKRKEIETLILDEIDFQKIERENKDIIIYYKSKY